MSTAIGKEATAVLKYLDERPDATDRVCIKTQDDKIHTVSLYCSGRNQSIDAADVIVRMYIGEQTDQQVNSSSEASGTPIFKDFKLSELTSDQQRGLAEVLDQKAIEILIGVDDTATVTVK